MLLKSITYLYGREVVKTCLNLRPRYMSRPDGPSGRANATAFILLQRTRSLKLKLKPGILI